MPHSQSEAEEIYIALRQVESRNNETASVRPGQCTVDETMTALYPTSVDIFLRSHIVRSTLTVDLLLMVSAPLPESESKSTPSLGKLTQTTITSMRLFCMRMLILEVLISRGRLCWALSRATGTGKFFANAIGGP